MPDSSLGVYSRPASPIPVTGQGADAPQVNTPIDDISAALNRRAFRDGRAPMLGNQNFNGYRATGAADAIDDQDYVTLSQVQTLIAAVQGVPTGALIPLTGSVVPTAWVVANGQALLRASYPTFWTWVQASGNLAATEGAKTVGQYGPGDGSTTFTVPNLYADNGYFIRPISSGRTIGTVQADENKSHNHTATFAGTPMAPHTHPGTMIVAGSIAALFSGTGVAAGGVELASAGTPAGSVTVDANGGTETRPKNIAYPVLIKT